MDAPAAGVILGCVNTDDMHETACCLEQAAGEPGPVCPPECPYLEDGCVLARVAPELHGRHELARLLLELRRELETARGTVDEDAMAQFHRRLSAGRE